MKNKHEICQMYGINENDQETLGFIEILQGANPTASPELFSSRIKIDAMLLTIQKIRNSLVHRQIEKRRQLLDFTDGVIADIESWKNIIERIVDDELTMSGAQNKAGLNNLDSLTLNQKVIKDLQHGQTERGKMKNGQWNKDRDCSAMLSLEVMINVHLDIDSGYNIQSH